MRLLTILGASAFYCGAVDVLRGFHVAGGVQLLTGALLLIVQRWAWRKEG